MTEATSASLGTDNTTVAAAQAAAAAPQTFQNDLHRLQFESLDQMIKDRNALVGRANAANGDRVTLTETIRDTSTDPEIVNLRESISELIFKLDALVQPLVEQTIAESAGDVSQIEEQIKATDKTLKTGLAYFKSVYGEDAAGYFTKQERLKGTQLRSGSGGRRIRGFNLIVTIEGEDQEFENFSSAAKYIGVDTVELQRAFFDKAGTEEAAKLPTEVKFVVEVTEVDADGNESEVSAMVHAYKTEAQTAEDAESDTEPEDSPEDVDLENL